MLYNVLIKQEYLLQYISRTSQYIPNASTQRL
jgi:hypothetical protein